MSGLSRKAQALQARLTRMFIATLPEKHASFEASWDQVRVSQWSPEPLAQLGTLAHKLAGSAGSYGFEELGALALKLDVALDNSKSTQEQRLLIERLTVNLIKALAEAEHKAET